MPQFKTVSLADQVFQKLENDIISGVYARGEILTELKLVEQLGVSRTPIREALRRLEQERLIEESGKGSVVLGITLEDLIDIMDIRQRIEGLACAYAAVNATQPQLAQLRQINDLQEFYYSKQDTEQLRQMDDQFHDTIYTLCGHSMICDTLRPLHRKSQLYRKLSITDTSRLAKSMEEHSGILDAIVGRQPELAAQRMTEHIQNAKQHMIERFDYHG